jgi:hypothetical protein
MSAGLASVELLDVGPLDAALAEVVELVDVVIDVSELLVPRRLVPTTTTRVVSRSNETATTVTIRALFFIVRGTVMRDIAGIDTIDHNHPPVDANLPVQL